LTPRFFQGGFIGAVKGLVFYAVVATGTPYFAASTPDMTIERTQPCTYSSPHALACPSSAGLTLVTVVIALSPVLVVGLVVVAGYFFLRKGDSE
jgi:hypothetical protein